MRRRLTLAVALFSSVLLHLLAAGSGHLALPSLWAPDEVLERRMPAHVQQVRLAPLPAPPPLPATPGAAGSQTRTAVARGNEEGGAVKMGADALPPTPPVQESEPKAAAASIGGQSRPPEQAEAAPQAPAAAQSTDARTLSPAQTSSPAAGNLAPAEPAPAFPVQLSARIEARLDGLSGIVEQQWLMEGFRYTIDMKSQKFGIGASLSSEGRIAPEGGLLPERSQATWAGKVHSFTEYRNGTIRLGGPGSSRELPLPVVPQDLASLPFHLAVTFTGQPQTVFISTGRRVYQSRFTLVAEEKLKLPVGTLRTLHLAGERFDHELREMVQDFDIWLAPDYLNFPVKVSGHLRGGESLEYRVQHLEIEGRTVLGQQAGHASPPNDDAMPAPRNEQVHRQSLNIP